MTPENPNAKTAEPSATTEPAPAGVSLAKTFALAVLLVIVLLAGAVFLLGGSSFLPFNYEGF